MKQETQLHPLPIRALLRTTISAESISERERIPSLVIRQRSGSIASQSNIHAGKVDMTKIPSDAIFKGYE